MQMQVNRDVEPGKPAETYGTRYPNGGAPDGYETVRGVDGPEVWEGWLETSPGSGVFQAPPPPDPVPPTDEKIRAEIRETAEKRICDGVVLTGVLGDNTFDGDVIRCEFATVQRLRSLVENFAAQKVPGEGVMATTQAGKQLIFKKKKDAEDLLSITTVYGQQVLNYSSAQQADPANYDPNGWPDNKLTL